MAARADELTLVRTNPLSDKWFLPAEANGIPDVPPPALFERASTWLGLSRAPAALIVGVGAWLWIGLRRRPTGEQQP